MRQNNKSTPIAWPLRVWLLIEVFFGLAAISSVGFFPERAKDTFAWPIQPTVTAAVLGAFYMASAPLFLLGLFARRWEAVRVIVLPAALFSTVELLATFIHWSTFSVGTVPFYVWFASYLLPPPIFLAIYWWQQRRAAPLVFDRPLPPWLRLLMTALGALLTLLSVIPFIFADLLIAVFPWKLSALATRALCGWFIAVGTLLLSMVRENDLDRIRLGTAMLILALPAIVVQIVRYANQVDWSNPVLWIDLAFFAVICFCGLYILLSARREITRIE